MVRTAAAILGVVCAALCLSAASASAQEGSPADQAEAFYVQAVQLYNAGRYREALESFDKAIELQPDPIFHCNRGAVLLKLKEHREALVSLTRCRAEYEPEDPDELASIDAEVKGLEVFVRVLEPHSVATARRIREQATGPSEVPPVVDGGDEVLGYVAWGAGGVGVLSLGTALVLEVLTGSLIDEYELVAAEGEDRQRYEDLRSVIGQRRVLIGSLLTVGLVSAATSGVLFWIIQGSSSAAPPSSSTPAAGIEPVEGGGLRLELTLPF